MFKDSFAVAIGLVKPEIPLPEDFEDPEGIRGGNEKFLKTMSNYELTRESESIRVTLETGEMPPGVTGLIPDGSTKVSWRWMGEVFEESSDEILQNSIVVRNLQEAGVGSIEALKYLFPNKTEEERSAMMSGFPFRIVQQTQQSINSFIGLLGNLYQLPHPQTPDLPLASDPNLDLTGFLYRSLEYLRKELSYSGKYKPSSSDTDTSKLSDADQRRAAIGAQPAMSQAPSPVSQVTACPQAPVYQASAQAPQASAANPWQEAFQALSASLNTSSPSQAQVPYSAYQTPTPQASSQASWASTQQQPQAQYSAPRLTVPKSQPRLTRRSSKRRSKAFSQQQAAPATDAYLSQISDESLEVLEHFGAEAPSLLNQYACAVEDALIEQVQRGQSQSLMLEAAGEERAAMNLMLTDPDVLADYVNDFFGPNGPYPTETAEETADS